MTTSALSTSAAASAWCALRKPRTAGGRPSRSERYGNGAAPMPPPTRSGRATSRRKPLPSGPSTSTSAPDSSAARARVPGPIGSTRKPSSPGGARQRLIGRGKRIPGGRSMKNWPGIPGSTPPRRRRTSAYGPTGSTPATLSRAGDTFLQGEGLAAGRAGHRLDRRCGARHRRHAGHPREERGLADEVAVGAGSAPVGRVDDQLDPPPTDQVDDRRPVAGLRDLADAVHREPCGRERRRRAARGAQGEPERVEALPELDRGGLVRVADGEE